MESIKMMRMIEAKDGIVKIILLVLLHTVPIARSQENPNMLEN